MKTSNILEKMKCHLLKLKCFVPRIQPLTDIQKREAFVTSILKTKIFSRMATQDKITAIAKLISVFDRDHGYMPEQLVEMVARLNVQLNLQLIKEFISMNQLSGEADSLHQV